MVQPCVRAQAAGTLATAETAGRFQASARLPPRSWAPSDASRPAMQLRGHGTKGGLSAHALRRRQGIEPLSTPSDAAKPCVLRRWPRLQHRLQGLGSVPDSAPTLHVVFCRSLRFLWDRTWMIACSRLAYSRARVLYCTSRSTPGQSLRVYSRYRVASWDLNCRLCHRVPARCLHFESVSSSPCSLYDTVYATRSQR